MPTCHRRDLRLFLTGVTGLCLSAIPGCGLNSFVCSEPDHVYSTACPQTIDAAERLKPVPVEARYPGQASAADSFRNPLSVSPLLRNVSGNGGWFADGTAVEEDGAADGVVRLSDVRGAAASAAPAAPAAAAVPASSTRRSRHFTPGEPRLPESPDGRPLQRMETTAASPLADLYPDEYLFDGGDRNQTAGLHSPRQSGIETEDTLAGWVDSSGSRRTRPSNRVAIYAPRFGSVRSASGLLAETQVNKASGVRDAAAVNSLRTGQSPQQNISDVALQRLESKRRADGVVHRDPAAESIGTRRLMQTAKTDKGQQSRNTMVANTFRLRQAAILAQHRSNAVAWTRHDFPIVTASTDSLSEVTAVFKNQQTVGLEDQNVEGTLHIVKLADRDVAVQGDVLRFTIRVENTGDVPLQDVQVVDNLTPRLEYVPGSVVFDDEHPGTLEESLNGEGSSLLTFRLNEPLAGHNAGTITFQVRVR
ncbi:MAG: DUF11 domain-containing protein [Planctomycetota bacterium]